MKIEIRKETTAHNDVFFWAYDEHGKLIDSCVCMGKLDTEESCIEECIRRAKTGKKIEVVKTIEI